jgi:hypothetical protein
MFGGRGIKSFWSWESDQVFVFFQKRKMSQFEICLKKGQWWIFSHLRRICVILIFLVFCSTGVWTQRFPLAGRCGNCLSHTSSLALCHFIKFKTLNTTWGPRVKDWCRFSLRVLGFFLKKGMCAGLSTIFL